MPAKDQLFISVMFMRVKMESELNAFKIMKEERC